MQLPIVSIDEFDSFDDELIELNARFNSIDEINDENTLDISFSIDTNYQ